MTKNERLLMIAEDALATALRVKWGKRPTEQLRQLCETFDARVKWDRLVARIQAPALPLFTGRPDDAPSSQA